MSKRPRSSRRQFLASAGVATPMFGAAPAFLSRAARKGPVAIASANGLEAVKLAVEQMQKGTRPVDAAVAGVNLVEEDPRDTSVGYGGLPNADGIVELDSCCMDGPTHLAGAVAALRNIKYPSRVALKVLRRTDHVLLVGEGALRFARAHGFKEENLLTDRARQRWLRWKETASKDDDWIEAGGNELEPKKGKGREERDPGTIHLSCLDSKGNLGACTTTSGLSFKIPGRVGDSPLIGCGLYLDNDFGSAGSTGRGEAAILSNGSAGILDALRRGKSPTDACLEVLKRVARITKIPRLLNANGRPAFQLNFYCVAKNGEFGAASLYPSRYAVCTADGAERRRTAALFERR